MGIDVATNGDVYVVDFGNGRIQQLSATGQFTRKWTSSAWDLALDSAGNVITAGYDGLRKYSSTGQLLATLSTDFFSAVAVDDQDDVYAAGTGPGGNCSQIVKCDSAGTSLGTIVTAGAADGHVGSVNDIDVAGPSLYAIDRPNGSSSPSAFRAQRFDLSGNLVATLPLRDIHGTGYSFPGGIAADGGYVYLGDMLSPTLQGGCCPPERVVRLDTTQPTARLGTDPQPAYAGDAVTLDASRSAAPLALITDYRWDLDGDGSFETDTGSEPRATHTYGRAGDRNVKVRVTSEGGGTDTASRTVAVRSRPPAGPVGVSIDNGADFTNDPHVTLHVV